MSVSEMRTIPGERDECIKCIHCAMIFADQENRVWTVCDIRECINRGRRS